MEKHRHILDYFPSHIFWDAQVDSLNIEANSKYIIEKAMISCADEEDFNTTIEILETLYSQKKIFEVILSSYEFISKMKFYTRERYKQLNLTI